jgi:O-antigen ligase
MYKSNRLSIAAWLVSLYCLVIPFESVLAAVAGPIIRYLGVGIMAWLYIETLVKRRSIKVSWGQISLIIWFLISAISFKWSPVFSEWQRLFLIYGRNLALLLIVTGVQFSKKEFGLILKGVMIGGLLAAIVLILFPSSVGEGSLSAGRVSLGLAESYYDPNYMASMFLMPIAALFFRLLQNLNLKKATAVINGFFLMILLLAALRTGSRGGFLGITASLLLIFGIYIFSQKLPIIAKLLAAISICIILVIVYKNLPNLLLERYSVDSLSGRVDFGSNRIFIWKNGWSLFQENVLFGQGLGSFGPLLSTRYAYAGAHNMYLLVLVETGIFGMLFFISYFFDQFVRIIRTRDILTLSFLVGLLVLCFFLDSLSAKFFWNTLMVIGIFLNIKPEMIQKDKDPDRIKPD